ncbi:hypothetical protein D3C71_1875500 [compost metagenome]
MGSNAMIREGERSDILTNPVTVFLEMSCSVFFVFSDGLLDFIKTNELEDIAGETRESRLLSSLLFVRTANSKLIPSSSDGSVSIIARFCLML